ncbi:FAD/NAD(P)-binding domain-containing protein [Aspergillus unguis]
MKIIIVGAGIAGLAAGISVRRKGHDVQIFERSSLLREVGAAIHVSPNASRVLINWGFDIKRARAVTNRRYMMASGITLEISAAKTHPDYSTIYNGPWLMAHRVDLHNELRRLATDPAGLGKPVDIILRAEVLDYSPENGTVMLADGSTERADLVIAADGVHTTALNHVIGRPNPAFSTGWAVFRFLLTTEELENDPDTAPLLKDGPTEVDDGLTRHIITDGSMRRLVWYPCANNTMQNFVLIYEDKHTDDHEREDWDQSADIKDVMTHFQDFHPNFLKIIKKATNIKRWPLLYRDPLSHFSKGRLVLIGDAAHPMLPHQGQAGAQAIEDAAALGELFTNIEKSPSPEEIRNRLELFDKFRVRRVGAMQILSNVGQDRVHEVRELAKNYMPEGVNVPSTQQDFFEHHFRYDILSDSQSHLESYLKGINTDIPN